MSSENDRSVAGEEPSSSSSNMSIQGTQAMAVLEYNNPNSSPEAALDLAIQPAPNPTPNQGRQNQNLQDVLRYSIAATTAATQAVIPPMDDERRAFLEASLNTFTNSTVDRLKSCVDVLLSDDTRHDLVSCGEALEQIIDLVDNMDNASDFHKIGGFRVIDHGLHSPHRILRALTATLIAELSQNNVYIQDCILETNILSLLLNMVTSDPEPNVQIKSFYALSCIVRDHEAALREFSKQCGWTVLLGALQSSVEKLQLKACFLLSSVCMQNPTVIDELCDLGYVEQLSGLLAEVSHSPLVEHLLQALLSMATNSQQVVERCSFPDLQLSNTLSNIMETTEKDVDDYRYAQQINNLVFGCNYEDDGER